MAQVLPFQAYRYSASLGEEMSRLIAPPYDVIDPALRDTLYRLSEHNIARITRADRREDAGNPYADAGALWEQWRGQRVVERDARPALYVYEQHFEVHGQRYARTAVIGRVQLAKPGEGVMPHENTLLGPRMDRLELTRATNTQFGLIFGLYDDAQGAVDRALEAVRADRPLVHAVDGQDLLHRMWALTDPAAIAQVQQVIAHRDILIADGHHRYETCLAFQKEHPEWPATGYAMMALVNMTSPGLVILPIHRCIKGLANFDLDAFLTAIRKDFHVQAYPGDTSGVRAAVIDETRRLQAQGRHALGLFTADGVHRILTLRDTSALDAIEGHSTAWRRLDVTVLHRLILERLGITAERLQAESNVEYVQDYSHAINDAADRVTSGKCQMLFLLNPTRAEEVQEVARHNERMPQKSTFFFPKMYSGLVFYRMDE